MLTRWAIELQNYDFTVKHVAGKLNAVPDMLSLASVSYTHLTLPTICSV